MSIIDKIPGMGDNDLMKLFKNALRLIREERMVKEAQDVTFAIQQEWGKRMELAKEKNYKAETPEEGLLKTMGYKVGNDAEPQHVRYQLLNYIITGQLPFVGSPAYMLEWGEPSTKERYRKLHRVIKILASSGARFDNMEKAVADWEDDLVWLEQQWRHHFY